MFKTQSPQQSRLDTLNREVLVQWDAWNGADDHKKEDILAYRVLPLAAEREALSKKLLDDSSSSGLTPSPNTSSTRAFRALVAMRDYFPVRLAQAESRLGELVQGPWPQDFAAAQQHYTEDVQPWSDSRRTVTEFLRAHQLPYAADQDLTQRLQALSAKYGKYGLFLAFLHDVFRGHNRAGVPFTSGMCLATVRALLEGQSYYSGPSFGLLRGSCSEAITALRAAGRLREGLNQSQIEAYARRGPVVALIGGSGLHQHVGIVALDGGAVRFFSNSLGSKKVEPLAGRMGHITGILVLE